MKKIYQAPEIVMALIETTRMIAASGVEDGFNIDDAPETDDTSGKLSRRRRDIWQDEDEEEEEY